MPKITIHERRKNPDYLCWVNRIASQYKVSQSLLQKLHILKNRSKCWARYIKGIPNTETPL